MGVDRDLDHGPDSGGIVVRSGALVWVVVCTSTAPMALRAQEPLTCPPGAAAPGFTAGFGRRDMTPPPGAGLLGYGPDSRIARGFRQRLKARAMALQDARGERLVLAVADLDFISGALQRQVVARVKNCVPLDADRIILSATHTHAGPGQFTGIQATDEFGTGVPGFDPGLLAFLADRISQAILDAIGRQRPARAAWGDVPVWGIARIRGWPAHVADPHGLPSLYQPDSIIRDTPLGEVDPTLTLFRVDTAAGQGRFVPAGAWALFAVHGTAIPQPNDLYDADMHGVAARVLELGIDTMQSRPAGADPIAVGMIANGAEGNTRPETRAMGRECAPPVLRREVRPGGWRTPPGGDVWLDRTGFDVRACMDAGIADTRVVGTRLGEAALALFRSLGDSVTEDLRLSRHFEMVPLRGPGAPDGLCSRGRSGMAQFAGAETRETRYVGFRWFGIVPLGIEAGGGAIREKNGCWSPKRTLPGALESVLLGAHPFEEAAQLLVLRVGGTLIGSVPFEPTTTLGARMRQAMRDAADGPGGPDRVVLVGLANNYISYVTTRLEYQEQYYEGGSTLYGPASAEVFTARLEQLVRQLRASGWESPPVRVPAFPVFSGGHKVVVRFGAGPPPPWRPVLKGVTVGSDDAVLRWEDDAPGWVIPNRNTVAVVEREEGGAWQPVARDGTLDVEVRVVRMRKVRAEWEARWTGTTLPGIRYRFRVPDPAQPDWGLAREFSR